MYMCYRQRVLQAIFNQKETCKFKIKTQNKFIELFTKATNYCKLLKEDPSTNTRTINQAPFSFTLIQKKKPNNSHKITTTLDQPENYNKSIKT